jgi:hypothetical protein
VSESEAKATKTNQATVIVVIEIDDWNPWRERRLPHAIVVPVFYMSYHNDIIFTVDDTHIYTQASSLRLLPV